MTLHFKSEISYRRKNIGIISMHFVLIVFVLIMGVAAETELPFHDLLHKGWWSLLALCGLFSLIFIKKSDIAVFKYFVFAGLPYVLGLINTIFVTYVENDKLGVLKQSITSTCFQLIDLLAAFFIWVLFRKKAATVIFWSVVISYCITLFAIIRECGFTIVLLTAIGLSPDWHMFERNDIGVLTVSMFLYYVYLYFKVDKQAEKWIPLKIFVSFLIMFLCGKRSAFVGIFIGFIGYYFTKNRSYAMYKKLRVWAFIFVCAYVLIIKLKILTWLSNQFGIDSSGRLYVWDWFNNQYSLSPLYLGHGFQYIHKYMQAGLGENGRAFSLVNDFNYLHNSILQLYIENGFILFIFWFCFYLIIFPKHVYLKFGKHCGSIYHILTFSMLAIYTTDNPLVFPFYQLSFYLFVIMIYEHSNNITNITFKKLVNS